MQLLVMASYTLVCLEEKVFKELVLRGNLTNAGEIPLSQTGSQTGDGKLENEKGQSGNINENSIYYVLAKSWINFHSKFSYNNGK